MEIQQLPDNENSHFNKVSTSLAPNYFSGYFRGSKIQFMGAGEVKVYNKT